LLCQAILVNCNAVFLAPPGATTTHVRQRNWPYAACTHRTRVLPHWASRHSKNTGGVRGPKHESQSESLAIDRGSHEANLGEHVSGALGVGRR